MRFSVVILDLNGTLVDTLDDLTDALNDHLRSLGRPALSVGQVAEWPGENLRGLLKAALLATGPVPTDLEISAQLQQFRDRYEARLGHQARLFPGIAEALEALVQGGAKLAILTNKPQAASHRLVQQMGIDRWFLFLLAGDGDVPRKPDPAGAEELMRRCGGDRTTTLLVGSSRIDRNTARNAGIRCALIDHDGSKAAHGMGADYVLDGIAGLPLLVFGPPSGGFAI
ncbi:MAG: HAD hydrolase-like protein [Deltaproteobacteria bacterium]|nr:HAD hydrolase-like protein [Deltaproteobacteria bacterium]